MTKDEMKDREGMETDPQTGTASDDQGDVASITEDLAEAHSDLDPDAQDETDEEVTQDPEDGQKALDPEGPDDAKAAADEAPEASDTDVLSAELSKLRDQHLRLAADFENYRKRANTELAGNWIRARADLVRSLVEGLDDLQRVSQFTSEDTTVEALIEGVDLVERNFMKALTEAGLEVLDPVGEQFDPNRMEAMMRVPTEEDGMDETVHQVFQKGYMFKDQLVRPARVSVYKDDD
jgi:molecular chaperone GrpE